MPRVQSIAQDLLIDDSMLNQLPQELRSYLTTCDGLNGKCSVINNFGFCSVMQYEDPSLIELCSYGRPSEDFRYIWCYDTISQVYVLLLTPYPNSTNTTGNCKNQVKLARVTTLEQLLHQISSFEARSLSTKS